VIETCWAEQNQTGGMVKEMNKGHRHDTLVNFSGDWNWLKTRQMGALIINDYRFGYLMKLDSEHALPCTLQRPQACS
jgi:hypothetical protein